MEKEGFGTAWIALTYDCNNRCKWCYADSNNPSDRDVISLRYLSDIADFLKKIGIKKTVLIGGEPTIYPFIQETISELANRQIGFGMVSNGRRFSDKGFSQLMSNSGLQYLTISFCGSNAESHDRLTQIRGSFNQAISGLRNASYAGIKVSTNLVINKATKGQLEDFVNNFSNEPLESMGFNICGPCVKDDANNEYLISPREAAASFEKIYYYSRQKGVKSKLITPTPLCFFSERFRSSPEFRKIVSSGPCQMVTGRNFVIDSNLDIVPCTHLTGFPMFSLLDADGSLITQEEFISKLQDSEGEAYKLRDKMNHYPSVKCNDCQSDSCSGGCPLYWINSDPEVEITSPLR
jgi:radical SAM protein with 4Fe4S-binding SPASM domain